MSISLKLIPAFLALSFSSAGIVVFFLTVGWLDYLNSNYVFSILWD
ncbi:hypothetical protein HMPREF9104_03067 [Lentilactobacillus kisonensis F0435]|uniref:Uncharacterized protein n=1 Tax=Lentilactobacillus kisonensis F0435 TaxID=797516 RepID=H1LKC1_9LACO|nr:hypothetical protein HMPREF9104_03067 [Lentilactobacillus kisonensis F0435]